MVRDEEAMRLALCEGRKGLGTSSPNPSVGAVLVQNGGVVSSGSTELPGKRHAEIVALDNATYTQGATLYTTLEPCCHTNKRTPPCTERIISSGISRVVVGVRDPNPEVSGKGIERLKSRGIEVTEGVLEDDCRELHRFFMKWISCGLPYVTVKIAWTANHVMTWGDGKGKKITGTSAREWVDEQRAIHDAVLVGRGTAELDDPSLVVRSGNGRNPLRVVLDTEGRLPRLSMFDLPGDTLIFSAVEGGGRCVVSRDDKGLSLREVLTELGKRNVTSVLVEPGPTLLHALLDANLVDRLIVLQAPREEAGVSVPLSVPLTKIGMLGEDMLLEHRF